MCALSTNAPSDLTSLLDNLTLFGRDDVTQDNLPQTAYLWSSLLKGPLPPIPEHILTVYTWHGAPGLEIQNIRSEDGSEVNIVNVDAEIDPDLIYIDDFEEQESVKKTPNMPTIQSQNGVNFVSLYPEFDEQENTITPPCITSESGFNFCSIYSDDETENTEDVHQVQSTMPPIYPEHSSPTATDSDFSLEYTSTLLDCCATLFDEDSDDTTQSNDDSQSVGVTSSHDHTQG